MLSGDVNAADGASFGPSIRTYDSEHTVAGLVVWWTDSPDTSDKSF